MKGEFEESIKEEEKINAKLKKQGKGTITLRDGIRFFAPNDQLQDNFHYAPDFDSPVPETLGYEELNLLSDPSFDRERLDTFRNREILPESYVEQHGRNLRSHIPYA
jgi:hypothetical protein